MACMEDLLEDICLIHDARLMQTLREEDRISEERIMTLL